MAQISQLQTASHGITTTPISGLEIGFGQREFGLKAEHFLAAEESDCLWEARREERWVGRYESVDDGDSDLDRVAIWGRIGRRWFSAEMIVDGDGNAEGVIGRRDVGSLEAARKVWMDAR